MHNVFGCIEVENSCEKRSDLFLHADVTCEDSMLQTTDLQHICHFISDVGFLYHSDHTVLLYIIVCVINAYFSGSFIQWYFVIVTSP